MRCCPPYTRTDTRKKVENECQRSLKRVTPQLSQAYIRRFMPSTTFHRITSLRSTETLFRRDQNVQTGSGLNSPWQPSLFMHTHSSFAARKAPSVWSGTGPNPDPSGRPTSSLHSGRLKHTHLRG